MRYAKYIMRAYVISMVARLFVTLFTSKVNDFFLLGLLLPNYFMESAFQNPNTLHGRLMALKGVYCE